MDESFLICCCIPKFVSKFQRAGSTGKSKTKDSNPKFLTSLALYLESLYLVIYSVGADASEASIHSHWLKMRDEFFFRKQHFFQTNTHP